MLYPHRSRRHSQTQRAKFRLRASNASPRLSDSDSRGHSAESPDLPQGNLPDLGNSGDGAHNCRTDKELPHSSRRSSSPSGRIEADQEFCSGSERSENKSIRSDGEATRIGPPGTKAVYDSRIDCESSDYVAYEVMDIAHCQVPKGSPIVTAIVHCDEIMPVLYAKPSALRRKILGDRGEVIRSIKLSPDSWLLFGYR
jgi:hypothetical protein